MVSITRASIKLVKMKTHFHDFLVIFGMQLHIGFYKTIETLSNVRFVMKRIKVEHYL